MALDVSFFMLGLNVNAFVLPNGTEPFAAANFKTGVYVYQGNSLADFLTMNADWSIHFDPGTDVVQGIGLKPDCSPVLAPALTTALLASGFTVVVTWVNADNTDFSVECTDLPLNHVETIVSYDHTDTTLLRQPGGNEVEVTYAVVADSQNKAAFTFTDTTIAISVNGNAFATMVTAPGYPHNLIAIGCAGAGAIERMAFYPAQANASLPGLSAL